MAENTNYISVYFERLKALSTGDRTAMKRYAGSLLKNADGNALAAFYKALPFQIPDYKEELFFAVGCWLCLEKPDSKGGRKTLTKALKTLKNSSKSQQSFDKKLKQILAIDFNDMEFAIVKLTRLIKMLVSKGSLIDYENLLKDLLNWQHKDKFVQRNWAKEFYNINKEE